MIYKGGKKDIDAQDVQFAWVNIAIPKDTAAGNYTGTITVSADELDKPFELTYNIEVLNLVQPAPEATELQVWQHPFSVANYYLGLVKIRRAASQTRCGKISILQKNILI